MIRRDECELWSPPIPAEFVGTDWNGNVRLDHPAAQEHLRFWGIELTNGMRLVVFDEDGTDAQDYDDLIAVGVAEFDPDEVRWVAADWRRTLTHFSELDATSKALYAVFRPEMVVGRRQVDAIRRSASELWSRPVSVDFSAPSAEGLVRLDKPGTIRDIDEAGIELAEGVRLVLYESDGDELGRYDDLIGVGVVKRSSIDGSWIADFESLAHHSELHPAAQKLYRQFRPQNGQPYG
jgi:hypothetical protein